MDLNFNIKFSLEGETMSRLSDAVASFLNFVRTKLESVAAKDQEIADLKAELAEALANDQADDQTIEEAQTAAALAQEEANQSKAIAEKALASQAALESEFEATKAEGEGIATFLEGIVSSGDLPPA